MKFVALVSGGKDSCFNVLHCLKQGHALVALANLHPVDASDQELDSFMFQTVGHDIVSYYDKCTGVPLFRQPIQREGSKNVELNYSKTENDEIEDLFKLLSRVKDEIPNVKGVSVGAILSSYQRTRVEDVCARLDLVVLSYLWQRDQLNLMTEMCAASKHGSEDEEGKMDARIIKVAAVGLDESSLNQSLPQMLPKLKKLNQMYDVHICGEGGEFETMVVDAPFFLKGSLDVVSHTPVSNETGDGVFSTQLSVIFKERNLQKNLDYYLKNIVTPPLFDEKWSELLECARKQKLSDISALKPKPSSSITEGHNYSISVVKLNNLLMISNIRPRDYSGSVQEQTDDVFNQLREVLDQEDITPSSGLYCSLLLSDISNFAEVNRIYSKFFSISTFGPLPPSRACVGSNILESGCHLQLSVILNCSESKPVGTKDIPNKPSKSGLHVQGRSYWAPCNIGPYSQAIWCSEDPNKVCYISGQIALNPPTMELVDKDPYVQATLSLRHFDAIKTAIGAENQLFATCFIADNKIIQAVVDSWFLYCSEMSYESEFWLDKQKDPVECLIIIQVSQLPREALCEWGGMASKNICFEDETSHVEDGAEKKSMPCFVKKNIRPKNFHDIIITGPLGDRHFITGFSDTKEELSGFLKSFLTSYKVTLYCNPRDIDENREFFYKFPNIEIVPVEMVFDYKGTSHIFGYHIMT